MSDIYEPGYFEYVDGGEALEPLTNDEAAVYVESEHFSVEDDRAFAELVQDGQQYYRDLDRDLKDPAFRTAYVEEALAQEAKDYQWFYKDLQDRVGQAFAEAFGPDQSEKLDNLKVLWPNLGYTSAQELIDREKPLRDSVNKWSQIHANHFMGFDPAQFVNEEVALGYLTKDSGEHKEFAGGGRRDSQAGKPRFDLLLPETVPYEDQFLTRFAALMGRGAEKYCAPRPIPVKDLWQVVREEHRTATRIGLITLMASVDHATKRLSERVTRSTQNVSGKTAESGPVRTGPGSEQPTLLTSLLTVTDEASRLAIDDGQVMGFLQKMVNDFYLNLTASALSAETSSEQGVQTLTMTIQTASREALYAHVVTKVLDSSEIRSKIFGGLSSTSKHLQLAATSEGLTIASDRNWEQFADPEARDRAKASAYRHFMQWFTGETDEDHGAATAFNIMAVEYISGILDGRWPARQES